MPLESQAAHLLIGLPVMWSDCSVAAEAAGQILLHICSAQYTACVLAVDSLSRSNMGLSCERVQVNLRCCCVLCLELCAAQADVGKPGAQLQLWPL